ncbi:valine--pyruvate transaminase [Roseiconus lacunae]|uniref:valine--pyruvate transaminase n=1 Tax=Roseiconus lacunae TaxID=2605694 RepID=UPI001E568221|nr:valine--pyruvate transaminase [Roseiconus lacunae]MCD0459297.1 valine--pyruvate transaminase [Roseiconus lacunae]
MTEQLSNFGKRLALDSGIGELMRDLGDALAAGDGNICMLGGGQPSHIPAIDELWQRRLQEIASDPKQTARVLGDYDPPAGDAAFRKAVAAFFSRQYGWPITMENVAVTAGGQTAFFLLLNAIAGRCEGQPDRKVLLPISPEYIGYADQSVSSDFFHATKPLIEETGDHEFKYGIDFDALTIDDSVAAMCLSRPTNPSSNVISDEELSKLIDIARQADVPLIVDNAYGLPFPGAIFGDAIPQFDPSMVLTYSLSKMGLPGTRTGIVIAAPKVIERLSSMNAISSLANNNLGQAITRPLFESDQMATLSRDVIRPYYRQRAEQARQWLTESIDADVPFRIHRCEGAFFLWLWLPGLPITSQELYERLKRRKVLVISGHHFFFGLEDDQWQHRNECLRLSYTTDPDVLQRGLKILGEEINSLYRVAVP